MVQPDTPRRRELSARAGAGALLVLVAMALGACGDEPPVVVPPGQWSAAGANLFVAPGGTILELTCRDAALPGTLVLDGRRTFAVDTIMATYGIAVTYSRAVIHGQLDGADLRLTVTSPGSPAMPETFVLRQQSAPHLPRCG